MKNMIHTIVGIISRINDDKEKEYLLVKSLKDFGEFTGFYYPPGGHVEEGEELKEALVRELLEELFVEVIPVREIAALHVGTKDELTHYWHCDISSGAIEKYNTAELADVGWFTRAKMETMDLWPPAKRIFDEYIFLEE
jgi:8-oxo-dGTP pyrophosphatase MutT (NUDIX family)